MEEPEIARLHTRQSFVATDDNSYNGKEESEKEYRGRVALNKHLWQVNSGTEDPHVRENGCTNVSEVSKKSEAEIFRKDNAAAVEMFANSEINVSDKNNLLSEKDYCGFDSDPESITFSDGLSLKNQTIDSSSDEFLFETDFCGYQHKGVSTNCMGTEILMDFVGEKEEPTEGIQKILDTQLKNSCNSDAESIAFSDGFAYVDHQVDVYKLYLSDTESIDFSEGSSVMNQFNANDSVLSNDFLSENDFSEPKCDLEDIHREDGRSRAELLKSDGTHFLISGISDGECSERGQDDDSKLSKFLSENDFSENRRVLEGFNAKEIELDDDSKEPNTTRLEKNPSTLDSEDMHGLESLWEHQDLIEQLRMELRKVREIGLPTILEESESPRTIKDLKSWRIDENFLHEDAMGELQKFYKSYRERMRKFDILNYQKLYAVGELKQLLWSYFFSFP